MLRAGERLREGEKTAANAAVFSIHRLFGS